MSRRAKSVRRFATEPRNFTPVTATHRCTSVGKWAWPRGLTLTLALATSLLVPLVSSDATAAATTAAPTTSYYETGASSTMLYTQGESAGLSGAQGIVILDFGRPASDGTSDGTLDYAHDFLSFADITAGVENFVMGYYNTAPADTRLDVAIGSNDSCGVGQPCGSVVCGCPDEPSDYVVWGQELAATVEQLGEWSTAVAPPNGFTDTVHVVAGDDAEPAFDPGFYNTEYVMQGYAETVGGSYPPMVDYGSADPGFWSNDQILQIANGFAPNVAMPEIYNSSQIGQWASVVAYANATYGEDVTVFGVLTTAGTDSPQDAAAQMLDAVGPITGQGSIPWESTITN